MGHFEYLVTPFGLTSFQALVNDVDFLHIFVFGYLDDSLIFSRSLEEHKRHMRAVLQRLLENRLYVKAEKCEFHKSSVSFLGYVFVGEQVRTDPHKIQAVAEWPVPSSRKEVQRSLGFANFYRHFIRNYSQVAAPLTCLTSTKLPFQWSSEAEAAFATLKNRFTSAPILVQPDPDRKFVVEVDGSDSGMGAVLSQRAESEGKMYPWSSAERNYDVGNRELLAGKLALEEWRHWLEGVKQSFLVWTDHKNLIYVRNAKRLNSRQASFLGVSVFPSPTVPAPVM